MKLKKIESRIFLPLLVVGMLAFSLNSTATVYYVDSTNGNDAQAGTLVKNPWKSLAKISSHNFNPGDTIYFHRGREWAGGLIINSSGNNHSPIVYTAYGKGPDPVIKNPGTDKGVAIMINARWVVVEKFLVRDAHAAGIEINSGAEYNIVRNNEATKVGIGISVHGNHNLVTHNYAHDLTMVRNTKGGDDDFGAVGIWLFSSGNEVSYNRMINCKAPSFDYGSDGGVVEFYGDVDSCYVHHNYGENCVGAFEIGGQGETVSHNKIAYNVFVNNGVAGGFHVGGKFGVIVEDMRIENNVFLDTIHSDYAIGFWNGVPHPGDFAYRNNIFYIPNYQRVSNDTGFIHENNIYYLDGKKDIGIVPGPGDKIADPLFRDASKKDFHLAPGSPAIDAGKDLKYKNDFEGMKVPEGSAPDIGAYEFNGKSDGKGDVKINRK
jgi:hypothetical protein